MNAPEEGLKKILLEQLSGAFTSIPFNRMLGFHLDRIDAESVSMSFKMKPELIGNFLHGILHGGVISSVLDMAGGMVVMAATIHEYAERPPEELMQMVGKTSTIDLHVCYMNPGRGELFTASAWLLKRGKQISFARMELSNEAGLQIATANGTYQLKI